MAHQTFTLDGKFGGKWTSVGEEDARQSLANGNWRRPEDSTGRWAHLKARKSRDANPKEQGVALRDRRKSWPVISRQTVTRQISGRRPGH